MGDKLELAFDLLKQGWGQAVSGGFWSHDWGFESSSPAMRLLKQLLRLRVF